MFDVIPLRIVSVNVSTVCGIVVIHMTYFYRVVGSCIDICLLYRTIYGNSIIRLTGTICRQEIESS